MSDTSAPYQGGDVQLNRSKPTGLPFKKPMYELPPYEYTGDVLLMLVYETDETAIREVLPRELEPEVETCRLGIKISSSAMICAWPSFEPYSIQSNPTTPAV